MRAVFSTLVSAPLWLIPAELLDGVASGLLGVVIPVLVADLTWGCGHTQTALGMVNRLQGIGGALSGVFGGMLVNWLGWTIAFLGLAVPGAVAFVLALWLAKAVAKIETTDAARHVQGNQAQ